MFFIGQLYSIVCSHRLVIYQRIVSRVLAALRISCNGSTFVFCWWCNRKCRIRFPRSNSFLISGWRVQLIQLVEKEKPELFLRTTPSLHSFLSSGSLDLVARRNKRFRCSEQQESFFTAVADLFVRRKELAAFIFLLKLYAIN